MLINSIFAGVCIGLGCWVFLSSYNALIGALLFSCGLCAIRIMHYDLFTGKIQYMKTSQYKLKDYLTILIGNLIGIFIMVALSSKEIFLAATQIGQNKMEQPFMLALIKGIGCGSLMTIATYKDTPLYITILCVFTFITAGFNHCIADAFYFLATKHFSINWFAIVLGNILGGLLVAPKNKGG